MAVRDTKGRERGRIWDRSRQVVQDDTRSPYSQAGHRGEEMCAARWGGVVSCGQAELGQSSQAGPPGGDGQLHGLLFRGGD